MWIVKLSEKGLVVGWNQTSNPERHRLERVLAVRVPLN
jgi:hypothetical protein